MTVHSFLFVHSPLVGPSSLRRLALAASVLGHQVALPDLTPTATAVQPHHEYLRRAVAGAQVRSTELTIVGHSGAGAFLPAIDDSIAADTALIFVDAVIPPREGAHTTPAPMKDILDEQTEDGLLRPWLMWWPHEVLSELLPEASDRAELMSDMPRLPRSFYDVAVDAPPGWSEGACAYLRLSAGYDGELDEAVARHWPTATLDSTHLGTHTHPDQILHEVLRLADRIRSR